MTPGHDWTLNFDPDQDFTLHCNPGSWFHVELWPRFLIQRWIVTPGLNSTLTCDPKSNYDLGLGSQFNVEFWPGVIIKRGILNQGHNSTWNSDPSTYLLPMELRLKNVSKFNSVIKIQQLRRVIIQQKIHWILTPGWYSIGGSIFYVTPAKKSCTVWRMKEVFSLLAWDFKIHWNNFKIFQQLQCSQASRTLFHRPEVFDETGALLVYSCLITYKSFSHRPTWTEHAEL